MSTKEQTDQRAKRQFFSRAPYFNGKPITIGLADQKHVAKNCRVRKVYFEKETTTIQLIGEDGRWLIEVDLRTAQTPEELLSWCFYLSDSCYGTPQIIGAVLKIVDLVIREMTDTTPERCYCDRKRASKGREENGFNWEAFDENGTY